MDRYDMSVDSVALLNIFPQEVLDLIFHAITDHGELERVQNASSFFRQMLAPIRVLFLFPKVLEAIPAEYKQLKYLIRCNMSIEYCTSEVLKLRLVCRTWAIAVDNFLQKENHHTKLYGDVEEDVNAMPHFISKITRLIWTHNVEKCMDHFIVTHNSDHGQNRNPFVGRSAFIHIRLPLDIGEPQRTSRLLTELGHHIWYLHLQIANNENNIVELFAKVRDILDLLPHLKSLSIEYLNSRGHGLQQKSYYLPRVSADMALRPMPTIKSLQTLRIYRLPALICQAILGRNRHVKFFDGYYSGISWSYDIFSRCFISLDKVSMKIYAECEFKSLEDMPNHCKLKKLNLHFQTDIFVEWGRIFSFLENMWGDSLTNLSLGLPRPDIACTNKPALEICKCLMLNLPRLMYLKLSVPNLASFHLLLPIDNSLQVLHLTLERNDVKLGLGTGNTTELKPVIDIVGFKGRLHESNIWTFFPNLHKFILVEPDGKTENNKHSKNYVSRTYSRTALIEERHVNNWELEIKLFHPLR